MSQAWYNTVNYSGEKLERANARALSQENLIKEIFLANPGKKFSPSQMLTIFQKKYDLHPPITSLRRAMTSLTLDRKGKVLAKTQETVVGMFGDDEHLWELNSQTDDKELQEWWNKYQNGDFDEQQEKPKFVQPSLF